MKVFSTITEKEILNMAYHVLLGKWLKEQDRIKSLVQEGKSAPIAEHQCKKYYAQSEEIRARILEIEATERQGRSPGNVEGEEQ